MADFSADVVIVGAGAAGAACAQELRARGFGGSVVLVGREPDLPYSRPLVSKDYLSGAVGREATRLRSAAEWDADEIELLTRVSVMKLDPEARTVKLSDKRECSYDKLLLATGANVRRLRVPGSDLDGIHYLRALANADAVRADAQTAEHVVLVGGSFVACEVAATLTAIGKRCTMVMTEELPLSDVAGTQAGWFFARALQERGIETITSDSLERFEAAPVAEGQARARVGAVVTASGREIPADMVVMGTGAVPDVMLARSAKLALGETGGVACARSLETSAPGVWAAGDVCEFDSVPHGRALRIEHWDVAEAQGRAVAAAMLGAGGDFTCVPYFWSDLSDWCKLEYVGVAEGWDREVLRGSLEDGAFSIFYFDQGVLRGCLAVNRPDDLNHARRLLAAGGGLRGPVDALAGLTTDLSGL